MIISILSTFYNDKKMLKRVMDSVLMQSCTNADYKLQIRLFMDKTLRSYYMNRMMVIYYADGTSNRGVKRKLESVKDGQRALVDCGVKFAWFITFCRIIRAIFAYAFASHKKVFDFESTN